MNYFVRIGSYLLHPLLMPLLGALLYYIITPRYVESDIIRSKLAAVAIITVLIPVVTFFLLKNLRIISSIHLHEVKERKIPLMIQCILLLLVIKMVFDPYDNSEMYYFFVGVLFSGVSALIMVFFNFKVSLHQMGVAGLTMFAIALSIHFQVNMLLWIGFFLIGNGWVASSRLEADAHSYIELITGFFLGVLPQIMLLNLWL